MSEHNRTPGNEGASTRRSSRQAPSHRAMSIFAMLVAAAAFLGACAASDPPPTSPLAETSTPTTAPSDTPAPPTATVTITPPPTTDTPADDEAERERVAGEAISRLAEWTGQPETDFLLDSIEAVDWPSGCLVVERPGIACTMAIVPGYRVLLRHAGQPNGPPYAVHASSRGQYLWAPSMDAPRTVEEIEGNLVRFEALNGSDEMGREHRVVPGSLVEPPLADLAPGDRVHVAVTWPLPGDDAGLVVWMVPTEE